MSCLHVVHKMNVWWEVESVCPSSCSIFEPFDEFRLKFGNVCILMSLAEVNYQNVDLRHILVDEKSTNFLGKTAPSNPFV